MAIQGRPLVTFSTGAMTYTEGEGAVSIDPQLTVSDPASESLAGATVQLAGYVPGQDVLAFPGSGAISSTWDSSAGTLTLSGTASVAQYQAALQSVTYANTGNDPVSPRTVQVTVTDGTLSSIPAGINITVVSPPAIDSPPGIIAPGSAQTTSDSPLVFSQAAQSVVAVVDPDAGDSVILVSLTARKGSLTLPNTQGLTFTMGSSTGSLAVQFSGTLRDVNAALDGLQFVPFSGYSGAASLRIDVNDLGNSVNGTPMSASTTVPITVQGRVAPPTPVAPPPPAPPVLATPIGGPVIPGPAAPILTSPSPTSIGGGSSGSTTSTTGSGASETDSGAPPPIPLRRQPIRSPPPGRRQYRRRLRRNRPRRPCNGLLKHPRSASGRAAGTATGPRRRARPVDARQRVQRGGAGGGRRCGSGRAG